MKSRTEGRRRIEVATAVAADASAGWDVRAAMRAQLLRTGFRLERERLGPECRLPGGRERCGRFDGRNARCGRGRRADEAAPREAEEPRRDRQEKRSAQPALPRRARLRARFGDVRARPRNVRESVLVDE